MNAFIVRESFSNFISYMRLKLNNLLFITLILNRIFLFSCSDDESEETIPNEIA